MFKHDKNLLHEVRVDGPKLYFNLSTPGDQYFNANNPQPTSFNNPNQQNQLQH